MQWSEVTRAPSQKMLRQFAGLCLVVFLGLAGWRVWQGRTDVWAAALAVVGLGIGGTGLARPSAVRHIYTGWMIAAFPIGWAVSRLVLAILFYGLFTPVALVFRLAQRDVLHRRRGQGMRSYWTGKSAAGDVREYFRQF